MPHRQDSQPSMTPDAQCLTCGYSLRGLPEPVCPECGRGFDPKDPSTFDADPRLRRRRRWAIRSAIALTVLAVIGILAPRGILKADVTFTCTRCGKAETVSRWQLNPPQWIPFAYPGIESRTDVAGPPAIPSEEDCNHAYDYAIRSDLPIGGRVTAGGFLEPSRTTINGAPLRIEDASPVLRALLKPGNNGVGP